MVMSHTKNLSIYCQSHGLLFQFLLTEFLATLKEVQAIEQLYKKMEKNASEEMLALLEKLFSSINALTGSAVINQPYFPWSCDKGCLNKLHHYCYLYAHLSPDNKKETAEINTSVRKAFHSAMESRELLLCLQQESHMGKPVFAESQVLHPLLDKLIDNLTRVSRLLLPIILSYREDENVLFFLLSRQEEFDSLYQSSCLAHLLQQMYPGGLREAKDFLLKQYTKRGFDHLLALIDKKMVMLG